MGMWWQHQQRYIMGMYAIWIPHENSCFMVYSLALSLIQATHCCTNGKRWTANWKWCGRKWSQPNLRYYHGETEEYKKTLIKQVSVWVIVAWHPMFHLHGLWRHSERTTVGCMPLAKGKKRWSQTLLIEPIWFSEGLHSTQFAHVRTNSSPS